MHRERRGLSGGTVLMLLVCAAAAIGTFAFLQMAGKDSPAASMQLEEIAGAVGQALRVPDDSSTVAPQQTEQFPLALDTVAIQAYPTISNDPISITMTIGGMLRFDSDIQDSHSFDSGGQGILAPLVPRLHADLNVMGLDQALISAKDQASDVLMPVEALDMIKASGINALVMTGEKILDGGLAAAQRTLDAISARRLRAIGLGEGKVTGFRINGLSISWLHASERLSAAGHKATSDDERTSFMLPYNVDTLIGQVAALKEQADVVVVSLNWQTLAGQTPTAAQRTIAHRLGQAGADMIVGMGGEQVQGLELYQLKEGGDGHRDVLIAYSLGNILTENRDKRELLAGVLVHLTLTYNPKNKTISYDGLSYSPSYVRKWTAEGKQRYQVMLSAETPPDDMSKTQREQMAHSLQLIREAFAGSPAGLQR
jgi:hypothetical protein